VYDLSVDLRDADPADRFELHREDDTTAFVRRVPEETTAIGTVTRGGWYIVGPFRNEAGIERWPRLYSGTPATDEWIDYGNNSYQYSLERIHEKFERIVAYLQSVFEDLSLAEIQLWAPYVSEGYQTEGLTEVVERIESAHGMDVRLVINDEYTARMNELREAAGSSTEDYSEVGFRFLQILEGLR
jgi:hypothetical protein